MLLCSFFSVIRHAMLNCPRLVLLFSAIILIFKNLSRIFLHIPLMVVPTFVSFMSPRPRSGSLSITVVSLRSWPFASKYQPEMHTLYDDSIRNMCILIVSPFWEVHVNQANKPHMCFGQEKDDEKNTKRKLCRRRRREQQRTIMGEVGFCWGTELLVVVETVGNWTRVRRTSGRVCDYVVEKCSQFRP